MLQTCPLFRSLPVQTMEALGHIQTYAKGVSIIEPQQWVDSLAVVVRGRVDVFHLFSDGSRSLMSVMEDGGLLAAELVCTRTQIAPYHAAAAEPTTLFWLPAQVILKPGHLEEPMRLELHQRLLQIVADESVKKTYRLAILSQKGLRERILTYLTMQADKRRTDSFSIAFSREDLASFLCVNRSALSHELSLMQQDGLIRFYKNQFTLLRRNEHEP